MNAEGPRKRPFCLGRFGERFGPEAKPTPPQPSPATQGRESQSITCYAREGDWSSATAYGALLITAQARRAPALPVGWVL